TLLNILNGNLSFDEGKIENSSDTIFLESNDIPFEFMTADEFIKTTFLFKKMKFEPEEKDKLFKQLQFQPENKIIKDFSKGMKSKLYLIIAFLSKPEILLLDEPFSDIDLMSFRNISQILKTKKEKMTVIFSTHVAKISFELSDKIVYLQENGARVFENHFENSDELETYIFEEMSNES
ncbi:ATP-binding cassette domain-containing protein, partial [Lactovum odontotermitis]